MSEIIIENVTQFVEAIRNIATNDQTELFFRGHADRAYVAEPAIFRNKEHLKSEKYLFNDMVTQCPEEFKDCQYTFEYLVKMQHYGLPTRLLDITINALVALYFACCSLSGEGEYKDGQVLVYQVQKGAIKNYNSDTVSVLSNLAHLNSDFELYTEIKPIYLKNLMEAYVKLITLTEGISELKRNELVLRIKDPQIAIIKSNYKQEKKYKEVEIIELIERIVQIIQFELRGKIINLRNFRSLIYDVEVAMRDKKIYFCNLKKSKNSFLLFIKQEKNYFIDQLTSEYHLKRIVCVRAKLNNPRIIR